MLFSNLASHGLARVYIQPKVRYWEVSKTVMRSDRDQMLSRLPDNGSIISFHVSFKCERSQDVKARNTVFHVVRDILVGLSKTIQMRLDSMRF